MFLLPSNSFLSKFHISTKFVFVEVVTDHEEQSPMDVMYNRVSSLIHTQYTIIYFIVFCDWNEHIISTYSNIFSNRYNT